jgi:hypothetical protein
MPKTIINVNRSNIQRNNDRRNSMPVITVFNGVTESHCNEVIIYGQDGKEAARIKYNREGHPNRDVKVWIETDNKIDMK